MHKLAIVAVMLLATGLLTTLGVTELEERDVFCTSCHLSPETTYHTRSLDARAIVDPFELADLASFHYWDDASFRCIDCHRGDDTLPHRARVLLLAAGDTLTWAIGEPDQSVEKGSVPNLDPNAESWVGPERYSRQQEILNAGCLKCHGDTLTLVGFDNHFHNKLPAAQEALAAGNELSYPAEWETEFGTTDLLQAEDTLITCLDCHRAHVFGFESEYFLDRDTVLFPACVQCHKDAEGGPLDLVN
jgi:hypothetical protein